MKKVFKNKKICFTVIILLLFLVVSLFQFTFSQEVEDESLHVAEDTDLTYYLTISYDGRDAQQVESNLDSNPKTASVSSGIIYVEDTIPEGLTFTGFVHAEGQTTFGSIVRGTEDSPLACAGAVIDDSTASDNKTDPTRAYNYYGLHYDPTTRKVSFQVKNLQAGCDLKVGIITHTPTLTSNEDRKDFYNFATGREDSLTVDSNTVHAWMGKENPTFHTVTYKYVGDDIPENAPALSSSNHNVSDPIEYAENSKVGVRGDVLVKGYKFNGWVVKEPSGLVITNNSFTMPSTDVVFEGSFSKLDTYTVSYKINGVEPNGYQKPSDKEYYANELVSLDIMKKGDIFNGYVFQGWTVESPSGLVLNTTDNDFVMPESNVVLVGEFIKLTYKVEYQFTGVTIPPNPEELLPDTEYYEAGATVTIKDVKGRPTGYYFLGWYSEDTFTMPEKDVIIYGEWREIGNTIRPTITKEIIDEKEEYREGETVKYKITVTNPVDYPIKNVMVVEKNKNAYFIAGSDYTVTSKHLVTIPIINANSSVIVYAEYKVTEDDMGTIENIVQIASITTDNNDELDPDGNYTDNADLKKQINLN